MAVPSGANTPDVHGIWARDGDGMDTGWGRDGHGGMGMGWAKEEDSAYL